MVDLEEAFIFHHATITPLIDVYSSQSNPFRRADSIFKSDESCHQGKGENFMVQQESTHVENINKNKSPMFIQNLPNEVLVHIFSFLGFKERIRSELVCRRWRLIGTNLPWRRPTKLLFTRTAKKSSLHISIANLTDDILLSLLLRCGLCLKNLVLSSTYSHTVSLTWKSVGMIGPTCPNLEAIKLHIPVNTACLKKISCSCPNLKVVQVFNFGNADYEDGALDIETNCKALECLAVSDLCLSEKWFVAINSKLKVLRFDKCTLMSSAVRNLITNCDALEELELAVVLQMGISQEELFEIFGHFQKTLKRVSILCLGVVEDLTWTKGLHVLLNLEELTLHHCLSVDDRLMEVVAEKCVKLSMLAIAGSKVTDEGLESLQRLPNLKVLDISNTEVSGAGLCVLAERGILEKVYMKAMLDIVEENVRVLAKLCQNLRLVDLSGTRHISNKLVGTFCEAVKSGFLRGHLKLIVCHTSVTRQVETCEGLEVRFT